MASEPEHRCVSENLGRLNDQSHRFPIRRLLSYRTTRHHASPPRIYIYPFATSFLFPRSLKTPFASNDNLVISFQSQTGVVVCIDFSPNLFFPFFFLSSSIDVKYNIKIVSTINRRKVEGGLEATENIIYPFHAAEQSSIVVTNVCKYDRARWLETIFSSLIESPIKLARRVFQNSRYKISRYYPLPSLNESPQRKDTCPTCASFEQRVSAGGTRGNGCTRIEFTRCAFFLGERELDSSRGEGGKEIVNAETRPVGKIIFSARSREFGSSLIEEGIGRSERNGEDGEKGKVVRPDPFAETGAPVGLWPSVEACAG